MRSTGDVERNSSQNKELDRTAASTTGQAIEKEADTERDLRSSLFLRCEQKGREHIERRHEIKKW